MLITVLCLSVVESERTARNPTVVLPPYERETPDLGGPTIKIWYLESEGGKVPVQVTQTSSERTT